MDIFCDACLSYSLNAIVEAAPSNLQPPAGDLRLRALDKMLRPGIPQTSDGAREVIGSKQNATRVFPAHGRGW